MAYFERIGVTGRQERSDVTDTLQRLIRFLVGCDVSILLDENIAGLIPDYSLQTCQRIEMGEQCDLVVVVGGDGSLLSAARDLVDYGTSVIGVNHGRLGFLTDISPKELETQLGDVLAGKYLEDYRFFLDARVTRDGQLVGTGSSLNDVVLHPGKSTRIIEFELYIDNQFVYKQRSDGLIIATPTGSTAYALSGGGPIMHPSLDAMVLVPMFPHLLTNRPLVINCESELRLVISNDNSIFPQISCDGQVHIAGAPGDEIFIRKKKQRLKSVHPLNHNFYEACRSKLRWNYQEYGR
ncbi:MAG: NAD(+) kinase [Candidatus Endonucleobacter bathymodioli]|uniref:NAD kinase n=1 Tax=Candidatus Endonucleibacter bathymodioli TaxID=539814 RepID=A0AA90NTQ9_9GAMM|nr:NAD(+) kinase [Candidatus Endonucleobacter bathymodioli]